MCEEGCDRAGAPAAIGRPPRRPAQPPPPATPSASSLTCSGIHWRFVLDGACGKTHGRRQPAMAAPAAPWNGSPHGGGDDGRGWGNVGHTNGRRSIAPTTLGPHPLGRLTFPRPSSPFRPLSVPSPPRRHQGRLTEVTRIPVLPPRWPPLHSPSSVTCR